jgi:hypothetical protein
MEDTNQNLIDQQLSSQFVYAVTLRELRSYFQAVIEVNKKGCKLSRDDKLKALLDPIIALSKLSPLSGDPIPFIDESINVHNELDFKRLNYNKSNYTIHCPSGVLDPLESCIYLTPKNRFYSKPKSIVADTRNVDGKKLRLKGKAVMPISGGISLLELHKKWLPTLTRESIQSTDLLDQILVAYTIKKALNPTPPWEEDRSQKNLSAEKLFELYNYIANGVAVKTLVKFQADVLGDEPWVKEQKFKDAKLLALMYLRFIIEGASPENIIKGLIKDKTAENVMLPLWVRNFYVEYLSKYVPWKLMQFLQKVQSGEIKNKMLLDLILGVLLNPYSPMVAGTQWKRRVRINRFNNRSYRPGKMGPQRNLTTWFFGGKGMPRFGKLYQLLRDHYKSLTTDKRVILFNFNASFDDDESEAPWLGESINASENDLNRLNEAIDLEFVFTALCEKLLSLGIPKREVDIFFQWKGEGFTQVELADKFNLSVRTIKRICRKIKAIAYNSNDLI